MHASAAERSLRPIVTTSREGRGTSQSAASVKGSGESMVRFVNVMPVSASSTCCATDDAYHSQSCVRHAATKLPAEKQRCRAHAPAQCSRSRSCIGPAHTSRRRTLRTDRVCGSRRKGAAADSRRRDHFWSCNGASARESRCIGLLARYNRDDGTACPSLREDELRGCTTQCRCGLDDGRDHGPNRWSREGAADATEHGAARRFRTSLRARITDAARAQLDRIR